MQRTHPSLSPRALYGALAVGTMAVGLMLHSRGGVLPRDARDILGDALWAAMVTWLIAAVAPDSALRKRMAAALAFCFAVEFSQVYHTPLLDALRATTPGHLVLGSGFDPRDLAAYTAGVLVAGLLGQAVVRHSSTGSSWTTT